MDQSNTSTSVTPQGPFGPKTFSLTLGGVFVLILLTLWWVGAPPGFGTTDSNLAKKQAGNTQQTISTSGTIQPTSNSQTLEERRKDLESQLAAVKSRQQEINLQNLALTLQSVNAGKLIRRIETARTAIESLRKQRTAWQKASQQALTSQSLGGVSNVVQAFVDIKLNPLATEDDLAYWDQSLAKLRTALLPLQDGLSDQITEVPKGFEAAIADIEVAVRAETDRLSLFQSTLTRSLAEAKPPAAPNAPTLKQAIVQRERELTQQREAAREAAARQVREKTTWELAAEHAKTEQMLADQRKQLEAQRRQEELKKQQAEAELEIHRLADAAERTRQLAAEQKARRAAELKREQDRRRLQAAMPLIRQYLVPFITPGHRQLNGNQWVYSDERAPLSFSGIKARGALSNDQSGYQAIYWIGGSDRNDRPRGIFKHYIGGAIHPNEVRNIRMVQRLLEEYGALLVIEGKLAK